MRMPKFRKKPVVVEAIQINDSNLSALRELEKNTSREIQVHTTDLGAGMETIKYIAIKTLEGTMNGLVDEWIITGVQGERYPCRNDIFQATYEPVEE